MLLLHHIAKNVTVLQKYAYIRLGAINNLKYVLLNMVSAP